MISGFWHFFRICKIPFLSTLKWQAKFLFFRAVAVRISVRVPRRQNGRHFAQPVRVLTSGILQIRKKFQNPEIPRNLELFSDLQIPLVSTLTGHVKCHNFFLSEAVRSCVSAQASKVTALFIDFRGTYKRNFSNLKKVPES